MASKKDRKQKELKVKVPVYATQIIEGVVTNDNMLSTLKRMLDNYNEHGLVDGGFVAFNRSNKTQLKVIQKVEHTDHILGENANSKPVVLLKTTTYNTNIHDASTVDADGTIRVFSNATKLVSEHNYMLFYPNIVGYVPNQKANWLIFVCGNSNKNDAEIIETAKLVIGKVLNLSFMHITPEEIMRKIQTSITDLTVRFIGIEKDLSDSEEKFPTFIVMNKLRREKTLKYKDVPFENVQEIIDDDFDSNEYQTREVSFTQGKKDFKIIKKFFGLKEAESEFDELGNMIKEAQQLFQNTAEQVFTDTFVILETEDKEKKLHDPDFVIEKITPIITNYTASYNV